MSLKQIAALVLVLHFGLTSSQDATFDSCGHDLSTPTGFPKDESSIGRFIRNLNLFRRPNVTMNYYLYKKAFPTCGREIRVDDDSLQRSGFNPMHPTRIIIHGWMSQSKSAFNRDVRDAYLSIGDYNVIVVDWSIAAGTLNYYRVVNLVENFGEIMANFTKHLHNTAGADYDNMYLIGHSLGAQIAGSAGKQIQPGKFNTIFALDPAGPAFRGKPLECRIDPTDAKYVESIQTSVNLGLHQPVGHASFFPNKGVYQGCKGIGCSHSRAYELLAESLTSPRGFWGTLCTQEKRKWNCPEEGQQYKMGGEPSEPKTGIFFVKTEKTAPFAMGRANQ